MWLAERNGMQKLRGAQRRLADFGLRYGLWIAGGSVLLAIAAQMLRPGDHPYWAGLLYGVAGLLFVSSGVVRPALLDAGRVTNIQPSSTSATMPGPAVPYAHTVQRWSVPLGLLVGAMLAGTSLFYFDFDSGSHAGWWLYATALAVLALSIVLPAIYVPSVRAYGRGQAFLSAPQNESRRVGRQTARLSAWLAWLLFGGIVGLAIVVRTYNLGDLPFGTWYDEAANGLEALRVANEPDFRPVYNNGVNASGHYLFLIVWFFDWFGVSTASIRLISAVMGVGLVVAGFGLGRLLFGIEGGLVLALFLAVARWAVNFSRIGMYNISTPLLAVLALYFLVRGVRHSRLYDFAAAGALAGLGVTFYSAYYLFLPILALVAGIALVRYRAAWRTYVAGLLVTVAAALIVAAPIGRFAWERPDEYFGRVRTTSLLARTAPEERLAALARNTGQHLRMFHVRGDPNGRHNLPGRPMLDPVTGALMVLGLFMCLARPRSLLGAILPLWLGIALLGGILSLDFESPQSLRSIGALPPAYLLATLPLVAMLQAARVDGTPARLHSVVTGKLARGITVVAVAMLLGAVAWVDLRAYFYWQARDFASWNAFSTPETLAARTLAATPGIAEGSVQPYLISLFDGHPTIRFLAPEAREYTRLETTDTLPIVVAPDRDILLLVDAERRYFFEEAQMLYPQAEFAAIQPPFGGPTVLYTVRISQSQQRAIQGVRTLQAPTDQTPDAAPAWEEWEAILMVPSYGPYLFHAIGPDRVEVLIGEETVVRHEPGMSASAEPGGAPAAPAATETQSDSEHDAILLAQGPHVIRMRVATGSEDSVGIREDRSAELEDMDVFWRTPEQDWSPIPDWHLYHTPLRPQGLLGHYYPNGDWSPPEAFSRIDGRWEMYFHVLPLARPYTVEWVGTLRIPESGTYALGVQSTDESSLWLDGEELAASPGGGAADRGEVELAAGDYPIRIHYADRTHHTHFRLMWQPPGASAMQTIPAAYLTPPQSGYTRLSVAYPPGVPGARDGDGASADVRTLRVVRPIDAEVRIVAEGLEQPTDVVIWDDHVWVAEPLAGRVRGFTLDGEARYSLTQGLDQPLEEPTALAVANAGDAAAGTGGALLVLDAATGVVQRFGADGDPLPPLSVPRDFVARSRGLTVNGQPESATQDVWIVATARGELLRLAPDGTIAQAVPLRGGGALWADAQPVDMMALEDGAIFVSDAGIHKLIALDSAGRRTIAWDIPVANTLAGPHLAPGPEGGFLRSAPEEGHIVLHRASGEPWLAWNVRSPVTPAARPVGVAVDAAGYVWVTDVQGGRLLRFDATPALSAE